MIRLKSLSKFFIVISPMLGKKLTPPPVEGKPKNHVVPQGGGDKMVENPSIWFMDAAKYLTYRVSIFFDAIYELGEAL